MPCPPRAVCGARRHGCQRARPCPPPSTRVAGLNETMELLEPYEYLSLSPGEAGLIVDALNGHMAAPGAGAREDLLLAVYDSLGLPDSDGDDLAPKWHVADRRGLVARIAALSDAQAEGVLRAARAYWQHEGTHHERLSAAGLI